MGSVIQGDFSGGMQDSDLGKGISEKSYLYARNFAFDGESLVNRPASSAYATGATGVLDGYFRYVHSSAGDCMGLLYRPTGVDGAVCRLEKFNAAGAYGGYVSLRFPSSFGPSGSYLDLTGVTLGSAPVFLQVGQALYVWLERGSEQLAFRWDGVVAANIGFLLQLPTIADAQAATDWVPVCRAACYAYGRVWMAVCTDGSSSFNTVAISQPVGDVENPRVVLEDNKLVVGNVASEDIIGFCPFGGNRIAIFMRNAVYVLRNCDGQANGISCAVADGVNGCVGAHAFRVIGEDVWYVSNSGVRLLRNTGVVEPLPITAGIGRWWAAHVLFGTSRSSLSTIEISGYHVLISVPVDGDALTHLLVFDLRYGVWVGVWNGLPAGGIFVSYLRGGGAVKLLGADCVVHGLDSAQVALSSGVTAELLSRAFRGPSSFRPDLFTRAMLEVNSTATSGGSAVNAVCAMSSQDVDTGASVTHHAAVTMSGHDVHLCVICRACQRIAVDFVFSVGKVALRKLQIFYRGK